jgi:uncharacterized membrane protein YphA (DoxX/SURF4 family)
MGSATVVMLVILRLSLGCHFLYEGVWKITNPEFSAEPFLTEAKGPAAPLFYAMIDDIDGRRRLQVVVPEGTKAGRGKSAAPQVTAEEHLKKWDAMKVKFIARYQLKNEQIAAADALQKQYEDSLNDYLKENAEEIAAYFTNLDRFEQEKARPNGAAYNKKRVWDKQQELRKKVRGWLGELDGMSESYGQGLWRILDEDQRAIGRPTSGWNPLDWSRAQQINFAVTYGLTAIGLCLMLGFFTPLAAMGGAAFMAFVVATQPSWPTIYPPAPAVVGHALMINKDFIEMVALLTLATTAAGRWGGLDFFVHRWFIAPWCASRQETPAKGK